jgi:sterol desaturase/sphingolipid hydroxylase (fatty acid hydroxylase superfamily)
MPINKFLYFGDFLAIPIAVLVFAFLSYRAAGFAAGPEFLAAAVFGVALWTLVEYFIHRVFYHHAPILSPLHREHHVKPTELIGVPSFISSGIVVVVCYFPLAAFQPVLAAGFVSGMLIGYAAYMLVHHATHHWKIEPGDWLYPSRVRHMAHHYRESTNFGVTTGFWDRVFGTERMPNRRLARP